MPPPGQKNNWRVLRTTTDKTDDTDWVAVTAGVQTVSAADLANMLRVTGSTPGGNPIKAIFLLEWLDASDVLIARSTGTFSATGIVVRQAKHATDTDVTRPANPRTIVYDSATLTGQVSQRPIVITDLEEGDYVTVRLTSMVYAAATKARLLACEVT